MCIVIICAVLLHVHCYYMCIVSGVCMTYFSYRWIVPFTYMTSDSTASEIQTPEITWMDMGNSMSAM